MLGENNRGGLPFDDPTGRWISDLTGYRVAFGRFQVKPKTPIIVPPEGLLESGAVPGVAQHRRDQSPGLDLIGGNLISAAGMPVFTPAEHKIAD
jgi:hypothetical protein